MLYEVITSWMFNMNNTDNNFKVVSGYMLREKEELYEVGKDKYERNSLAGETNYEDVQKELAEELLLWMSKTGDPGQSIDTKEEFNAQRKGNHFIINKEKE